MKYFLSQALTANLMRMNDDDDDTEIVEIFFEIFTMSDRGGASNKSFGSDTSRNTHSNTFLQSYR